MQIEVKTITPEVAAIMLANNPSNRNIRKGHVADMARDMLAGAWQTNGDAIRLNGDGSLIDGQHRLSACVQSGVPFETVVITGLPSSVRDTVDGGAKRTHGDRLSMRGVANATSVSACARMIGIIAYGNISLRFTDRELDTIIRNVPQIHASVAHHNVFPGMGRILTGVHCIAYELGKGDDADAFSNVLKTGIPTYNGDAAHALRERIISNIGKPTAYDPGELLRATVTAWRHFSVGTPIKIIKPIDDFRIKGWTPERLGL